MKKLLSFFMMLFAVLAVNAQTVVYTLDTTLEENKGTDNGYATAGDVTVNDLTWNATGNVTMAPWRIGGKSLEAVDRAVKTTNAFGTELSKVVLTLGDLVSGITVNSVSLSWADNAEFTNAQTIVKDYANVIEFVAENNFAANSFYKFDINVTVPGTSNKYVTFNKVEFYDVPAAGWDGTVTTSIDGQVLANADAIDGITFNFPGAKSIECDEEAYIILAETEDGWPILKVWSASYDGCTSVIDGTSITLNGWKNFEDVAAKPSKARAVAKKAAAEDSWYIQDFGNFIIDGESTYLDDIAVAHEAAAVAEPFAITVSNYRVEGTNGGRQEASEYGLSTGFQVVADPALYAGTAVATLSFNGEDQGEASINAYGYPSAGGSIQFNAAPAATQGMFAGAGEYTLIVPEGVFVDENGTPNAAFSSTWVILENDATPFDIAGVTMNWMGESIAAGSEVSALSYMYAIDTDKELAAGEGHIEFFDAQGQGIGVGSLAGNYIRFMNFGETGYTTPGTYTLVIPAGAIVDAEGNPCNKFEASWTVVSGAEVGSFAIESVQNGQNESSDVEALSYMFTITAANAITGLGEGNITLTDAEGNLVGGNAYVFGYEGEGGSNTVYARFTFDTEDHQLHTAGTYTLNVPAGMFVDAEGNKNEAFNASWTIAGAEVSSFAIESVQNGQNEGSDVEALSYMFTITAANAITGLGEGNITLTDAEGNLVGGNAYVFGYEGEGGSNTVYARFTFDTEDHQLHTAGTYTLNVPAGMFVDAEGNKNEAFNASWTIAGDNANVINIETVEVGTVVDDSWGSNDTYYTATVKFTKPEGAVYAYSEGLHMELNGENTGVPFQFGQFGMIELAEGDEVTLVYKDNMIAKTDDAEYEGDLRPAGSYVAFTEIAFLDADQMELPVTAKFTGSVVLPNLNEVTIGTPVFNVDEDPFYGKIDLGELEANGLKMTLTDAEGITPDMTIKVVATLSTIAPGYGGGDDDIDSGFSAPDFHAVMENVEFTGDAMFGVPTVYFTDFAQYISEAGAGAFMVEVSSIEVMSNTGVVASWTPNEEEGEILGTVFEVTEAFVIENVQAKVGITEANTWGDQFFNVTLTVPADEVGGLGVAYAYTEGVIFEAWNDEEATMEYFTFNANDIEGVEVVEDQDIVMVCTDAVAAKTSDTSYEGELRAEGTYPASCVIVLTDANYSPVATAEFRGELTLSIDVATGIKNATFNASNVTYNIAGQKVNANAKGLVIKNGKKVLVK